MSKDSAPSSFKWVVMIIFVIVSLLIVKSIVTFDKVSGNELGVMESWTGGVEQTIYQPRTYILFPAFMKNLVKYDASQQVFTMNKVSSKVDKVSHGRESDAYMVQSKEGQDLEISLNVRWRLDALKLIEIHKTVRTNITEKIIRPEVMRIVKDEATKCLAIDAYSGDGLVNLQKTIEVKLMAKDSELREKGIIVEGFVIEKIELDPKYISEIKEKQIATQRKLKAVEQEKAAMAEALVAKAVAQKSYEESVVNARRDKEVGQLNAEKNKITVVLQAESEKQKAILEAEAIKESGVLKAQSILAIGTAEAKANELKLLSYSVAGSDNYVKTKVAESMATAFSGIKGYLPSDMKVNILSENYLKSIENLMVPSIINNNNKAK